MKLKNRILLLIILACFNSFSQEKLNPLNNFYEEEQFKYYKFLHSKLLTNNCDLELAHLIIIPYKEAESSLTLKNMDFDGMHNKDSFGNYTKSLNENKDNYELVYKEATSSILFEKKRNWRKIKIETTKKDISKEFGSLLSSLYKKVLKTTSYPTNEIIDTHRNLYYFLSDEKELMEGYTYEPFDQGSLLGTMIDLNHSIILYVKAGNKDLEKKIITQLKMLNSQIQ